MAKDKILVKVHPEGKYVVDLDKSIDIALIKPNLRVALRNDSYVLHKILPNKVDPLVSLMKVAFFILFHFFTFFDKFSEQKRWKKYQTLHMRW
jgi:hypothetical protein